MSKEIDPKGGRPPLYGERMKPKALQQRHRDKLRSAGGKILQATIKDAELVIALQLYREENNLKSDTAALNEIVSASLTDLKNT